jgi:cobalt-zinc-cadmium efflux system membrane fusion protein
VYRHVGDPVQKGDLLGLIDAADVGRAKAELLQAVRLLRLRSEERQRQRQGGEAFPERLLREAEAAEVDARIRVFNAQQTLINLGLPVRAAEVIGLADEQLTGRLRFLGVPDSIRGTLDPATTTANLLPLLAPFDGLVIGSDMVEGEVVGSERPQFVVADVRRVWVTLDVRQEDVVRVRQGQRITFRPDGMPAVGAEGTVTWISTAVDAKTRTVQVRADVDNTGGQLRAHSFGTGRILIAEKPAAVAVPSQALQWDGSYPLVFVRRQDGLVFEPRQIRVGIRDPDYTEVLDGLRPGEVVATTGSHVLRSELFKGPTGAGD